MTSKRSLTPLEQALVLALREVATKRAERRRRLTLVKSEADRRDAA